MLNVMRLASQNAVQTEPASRRYPGERLRLLPNSAGEGGIEYVNHEVVIPPHLLKQLFREAGARLLVRFESDPTDQRNSHY